jgi:hypothetical protein
MDSWTRCNKHTGRRMTALVQLLAKGTSRPTRLWGHNCDTSLRSED